MRSYYQYSLQRVVVGYFVVLSALFVKKESGNKKHVPFLHTYGYKSRVTGSLKDLDRQDQYKILHEPYPNCIGETPIAQ